MYYLFKGYSSVNHQFYTIHSTHHSTYSPQCQSPGHPIPSTTPPSNPVCFLRLRVSYGLSRSPVKSCFIFSPPLYSPRPPPCLSNSSYQRDHMIIVFLSFTYFTQHNTLQFHPHHCKWQDFRFFGWLHSIPLYIYTTSSLSIHLLMDIQVFSIVWLLWTLLL